MEIQSENSVFFSTYYYPHSSKKYSKFVLNKCYFKGILVIPEVLHGISIIYSKENEPQVSLRNGGSPCFH